MWSSPTQEVGAQHLPSPLAPKLLPMEGSHLVGLLLPTGTAGGNGI